MKQLSSFLLVIIYLLFCNMSCEEYEEPTHIELEELTKIELSNIDFSGVSMVQTNEKIKKEAYVIGIRCLVNTYKVEIDEHWTTGKLLESNIMTYSKGPYANTEDDFEILTVYDFDDKHPQGSSVKDCFLASLVSTGIEHEITYTLILRQMPRPGIHSFRLIYKIKKDEKLSDEYQLKKVEAATEPIELY